MVHKTTDDKLVLGIPKGSLQESTLDLFSKAGYDIRLSSRSYFPSIDDDKITVIMFRAQEMSRYVEDGVVDVGLTGYDWVRENGSDVVEIAELVYAKQRLSPVQWVLAVPEESTVRSVEDLNGGIALKLIIFIPSLKKGILPTKMVKGNLFGWGLMELGWDGRWLVWSKHIMMKKGLFGQTQLPPTGFTCWQLGKG